ncbi:hypothetical protein D3C73_1221800 [compost metagenome]
MSLATGAIDDVTCSNFSSLTSFALGPSHAREHHKYLAERVCMPKSTSGRFEGDNGARGSARRLDLEKIVDSNRAGKPTFRALNRWLATATDDGLVCVTQRIHPVRFGLGRRCEPIDCRC